MPDSPKPMPCPCCGCHAAMHQDSSIFVGQHYEKYPGQLHGFRVECEGTCHLMTCWWHTKNEAKQAWNTRAHPRPDSRALEVVGYAIARIEDGEIDQALTAMKIARGDFVQDHYPTDESRIAVQQLRDAVNRMAAPIDYADALLRYIEQLERRSFEPARQCINEMKG